MSDAYIVPVSISYEKLPEGSFSERLLVSEGSFSKRLLVSKGSFSERLLVSEGSFSERLLVSKGSFSERLLVSKGSFSKRLLVSKESTQYLNVTDHQFTVTDNLIPSVRNVLRSQYSRLYHNRNVMDNLIISM